jgi:3-hydroxybutyryl-CoA dehydrogenase
MGPFELMDLVGIDTGFEVAKSFEALSFGEPRWRPNPIQARLVAAGRLGRKTGRGYYDYSLEPYRPEDPEPPEPGGGEGRVVAIDGDGPVADGLRERARAAGYDVRTPDGLGTDEPELLVDAAIPAPASDLGLATGGPPLLAICADTSLVERGQPEACGFNVVPPAAESKLVEVTRLPTTVYETAEAADSFFTSLGFHTERVNDAPGLVLGRIVSQLVNEAAFAVGEGVGSAEDVDAGLTLGLNHPRGAVEWGEAIGLEAVLATIDGLYTERHEERYRAAPLLRRAVGIDGGLYEAAD